MATPLPSLSPAESSYISTSLAHPEEPTRNDGRALFASRPIQVSYNVFPHANGSAHITLGGTEVVAGVRLEVVDATGEQIKGQEVWRTKVTVDITPQAFPNTSSSIINNLATHFQALLTSHVTPSLPALPILPNKKYFQPHLHLTLLSSAGNVPTALSIAARAAFSDLRVPKTKVISWVGEPGEEEGAEVAKGDMSGIKAAIAASKTKGKGKLVVKGNEDWDLDMEDGDGVAYLEGREQLPVLVALNLVPNSANIFLDATGQEEAACPTRILLFFKPTSPDSSSSPNLCGMRLEGPHGLDQSRVRGLLEQGASVAEELVKELNKSIPTSD
ncbi:hypothetical protein L202_03115 [Cryptococcus amylolentus CBS 6039]|uniref:Ribosomal RNA-processing protein 42 n=1 Tax=Cryptococcus amylolentus CBS 6039 TaxID=1295533 RepID=A0A1E3HXH6_9TREE|nr:hypothetical protein L202_03115 [Cryptococcus amylolentus CBS 6039]ODN81014.1 hypothetical protein L202_03115 [Cryptococcus amylolentus CBS 6039]